MKKWIEMAIKERKVTFVLAMALLAFGIYAYYFLPKQENPDTSSPMAQIVTILPGATAEEVELLLTKPIENAVSELEGISYVTSYSNPSASVVLVSLNYNVEYEAQWKTLKSAMQDLVSKLPQSAFAPVVETNLTESSGAVYALSSENGDRSILAEALAEDLNRLEGVKKVSVEGAYEPMVEVKLNSELLNKSPLTSVQIADIIKANNLNIPAGQVQEGDHLIAVATEKGIDTLNKLENIILYMSPENGQMTRLKDLAEIRMVNGNKRQFWLNGKEVVLVNVFFEPNQNIVLLGDDLDKAVDTFIKEAEETVMVMPFVFQPDAVRDATENFMINLLQGIGFVVLVILFGMGLRNAVVVSTSIPLSIAITIGVMFVLGIDLQQMSIAALIISLGILVDNSIVISDAIQEHLNAGKPIFYACFEGTRESGIPVLTSTLTTVAAFAPLMALPGEAGEFAKSLPIVVIISLLASYFVAVFVVPALGSVFFKKQRQTHRHSKNLVRRAFTWTLKGALHYRKLSYCAILLIILATGYGATQLEISLFPYADKETVYVDITAPQGSNIKVTEAIVNDVEAFIKKQQGVGHVFKTVGGSFPKFYLTVGVRPPSDDFGQIVFNVSLSNSDDRERFMYTLQKALDASGIEGRFTVNLLEINQPGPAVDVKLYGENRNDVNNAAEKLEVFLKTDTRTVKVYNDMSSQTRQYAINYDENAIGQRGLQLYDIQRQVNLTLSGYTATDMYKDATLVPIVVKSDLNTLTSLETLKVGVDSNYQPIVFSEVANIVERSALKQLKRHNQYPAVFVSADLKPGESVAALQQDLEAQIDALKLPAGVNIDFGGDKEIIDKYIKDLLAAALVAIIIIYLILLIQFNSFKQPIIVLATVPLSVVGSVAILLAFNMKITFTVGLGVASLIGIVVNNAILLLDYLNANDNDVADYKRLCVSAMNRRFKPIMLSSITTIIGLVPLALSGSSFFTPMAVALMGGLMVSTLLTLIVIPLIYYTTLPRRKKKLMKL